MGPALVGGFSFTHLTQGKPSGCLVKRCVSVNVKGVEGGVKGVGVVLVIHFYC